ncbi:ATP-binding protein [Geitlerinema sp. PCC 9228]|uniref:sensor histidine kinase n=1 Tax=Geitlerinema sp. PCC 9228 TaxID=111611 RepID=UPI000A021099|nr:ATP-binding protein [Geitlerinema sp. PCC 9228]
MSGPNQSSSYTQIPSGMNTTSLKVLLLEDCPHTAATLNQMPQHLVSVSLQIHHVERGEAALEAWKHQSFDVLLANLAGWYAMDRDRRLSLPTVLLVDPQEEPTALQQLQQGVQAYLVKEQLHATALVQTLQQAVVRFRYQQPLQASEHRLRSLFDALSPYVALLKPNGEIVEMNQTALNMAGQTPESVRGKPLWELPRWQYAAVTQQELQNAIATASQGNPVRYEVELDKITQTTITLDVTLKPLPEPNSQVQFLLLEAQDITERKQAETQMQEALKREREVGELKTQFVSMVSHEFRNPLTSITMSAKLLRSYSDRATEEQKQSYIKRILDSANRMGELIEDILLLGKAELGKIERSPEYLNLESYCQELVEEMRLADSQKHEIVFTCKQQDSQNQQFYTDKAALRHILVNLLSNALKYSQEGSTIFLDLQIQAQQAVFQVRDFGIGIPPEAQSRLFERFYRANNVGKLPGTGLGLAIAQRYVELLRGQIQVYSEVNVGTTFSVVIPSISQEK